MNIRLVFALGVGALLASSACPSRAEAPASAEETAGVKESVTAPDSLSETRGQPLAAEPSPAPLEAADEPKPESRAAAPVAPPPEAAAPPKTAEPSPAQLDSPPVLSVEAEALKKALAAIPAGSSDEERNERAALLAFYEARAYAPLWIAAGARYTAKGASAASEIRRADEWGLEARDFSLPAEEGAASPETAAAAEAKTALAILKYGRYARGGRIMNPSEQLSSYLDRRPQLLKPEAILEGVSKAEQPDAYLRGLHPAHPQFQGLRQKYLSLKDKRSAEAKKLLANMEEWRWMPADLSDVYIWNNIPEYMQRVVRKGEVIRKERIVAGLLDKQTPVFSRPLKKITFRPTWIVPDSIKVKELWPSLLRGGGLMRQWGLEVTTKEGEPVDWRRIDWTAADIRTYEVIQPNGSKSVLGKGKFSFPSQHTVFMHDTLERDKWMFRATQRTYSHGCMRVQNPVGLAEVVLREDKGWDFAKTRQALSTGGDNNEIVIEHKIPVHVTYFTALIDDDGRLHTFPDVYGHERRITLALEGKWSKIVKGRDHLAPVELNLASARPRQYAEDDEGDTRPWRRGGDPYGRGSGFFESLFGSR
jgi:L,D-transpeptidase YcbB